jgi:hypothetical protein
MVAKIEDTSQLEQKPSTQGQDLTLEQLVESKPKIESLYHHANHRTTLFDL